MSLVDLVVSVCPDDEQVLQLGLPEHAVRVVTQDIGGGFGPKAIVYSEDILVPYLARALGRPVRFVETRREHLLAVTQERDSLRSRLNAARTRIDALLERLPGDESVTTTTVTTDSTGTR